MLRRPVALGLVASLLAIAGCAVAVSDASTPDVPTSFAAPAPAVAPVAPPTSAAPLPLPPRRRSRPWSRRSTPPGRPPRPARA